MSFILNDFIKPGVEDKGYNKNATAG